MNDETRITHYASRITRSWLLIAALAVLLLGPLVSALFQATSLPIMADSGALAHDLLARYICPTPTKSYELLGFPMAVCARCWGATIGLWAAWFVCKSQVADRSRTRAKNQEPRAENRPSTTFWFSIVGSWFFRQASVLRLALALGALLLWTLEINTWPAAPLSALIVNGANGGFWAGMFAGSLWLAAHLTRREYVDSTQS